MNDLKALAEALADAVNPDMVTHLQGDVARMFDILGDMPLGKRLSTELNVDRAELAIAVGYVAALRHLLEEEVAS